MNIHNWHLIFDSDKLEVLSTENVNMKDRNLVRLDFWMLLIVFFCRQFFRMLETTHVFYKFTANYFSILFVRSNVVFLLCQILCNCDVIWDSITFNSSNESQIVDMMNFIRLYYYQKNSYPIKKLQPFFLSRMMFESIFQLL